VPSAFYFDLPKGLGLKWGRFPQQEKKEIQTSLGPEEPTTGPGLFISKGSRAFIAATTRPLTDGEFDPLLRVWQRGNAGGDPPGFIARDPRSC
jgi:hypothetical protein